LAVKRDRCYPVIDTASLKISRSNIKAILSYEIFQAPREIKRSRRDTIRPYKMGRMSRAMFGRPELPLVFHISLSGAISARQLQLQDRPTDILI
jgi:hypothetical protein